MSGAKGLPVAAMGRRSAQPWLRQDGDSAVLGRGDELKMQAKMRARFWEENDEQMDERVALERIEGFDQRREAKEKSEQGRQTMGRREEARLLRQKQEAEDHKERLHEVIKKEKARRDMKQLQDFLKDNEHSLMKKDEERTKAMKLAGPLPPVLPPPLLRAESRMCAVVRSGQEPACRHAPSCAASGE